MWPLIPLFWTSGDLSSGFQSQSGQPYSHLVEVHVLTEKKQTTWDCKLCALSPQIIVNFGSTTVENKFKITFQTLGVFFRGLGVPHRSKNY